CKSLDSSRRFSRTVRCGPAAFPDEGGTGCRSARASPLRRDSHLPTRTLFALAPNFRHDVGQGTLLARYTGKLGVALALLAGQLPLHGSDGPRPLVLPVFVRPVSRLLERV